MRERRRVGLLATVLTTCVAVSDIAAANDHARQSAASVSIESETGKVAGRVPDARVAVRNVKLTGAPPVDDSPSAFVRFDVFNEGDRDVTPVVVEIAILETPPPYGDAVPIPVTLVGPFRLRAETALKAGYSVHYELRLRNVSASCDCTASVDVVQHDSAGRVPHVFDIK